jgi:benzodiazapine receptor
MNNTLKLVICLVFTVGGGLLSGLFTASEIQGWFAGLQKPSWNPPAWLFAPVWTCLYALMGIALYLVWKSNIRSDARTWAVVIFFAQFALNCSWSYIFFHRHQLGWGFVDIIALWIAILCTIIGFARINRVAPWLLVPYIAWVSFAAMLNYSIWQLNA